MFWVGHEEHGANIQNKLKYFIVKWVNIEESKGQEKGILHSMGPLKKL